MKHRRLGGRLFHAAVVTILICTSGPALSQSEDPSILQRRVGELLQAGKHNEAVEVGQRYVAAASARYGEQHVEYARALWLLGHAYAALHRYTEAEQLYARSVVILERTRGPNHPDVGATLNSLAGLYGNQGRFDEARALYERCIAIGEKAFGPQHPNVAAALNNLGGLYQTQGRYSEAEVYYKRALAIAERRLGRDSLDLATGYINLGILYRRQGRDAEAEALYSRVLEIREKKLGARHPDVATILNSLALLYASELRFAEAEPLYKRALAIREEVQGPDHPQVGTVLNNLGELYREQGRFAEAEPLYKRAIAIHEKTVGRDDSNIASTLNNLALLYRNQLRYADAEPLYKRAIAINEKVLGANHPSLSTDLGNLAGVYAAQDRFAEAEPLYKRALALRELAQGEDHASVGLVLASLAVLYAEHGDIAQALAYQRRATAVRIKLGEAVFGQENSSKRQVLQGSNYFRYHVLLMHRTAGDAKAFLSESFNVAQWALQSEASDAVAQMSVRFAAGTGGLAEAVRERQDLLTQRQAAESRLLAAIGRADAPAAEIARKSIIGFATRLAALEQRLTKDFPEYVQLARPKPLDLDEVRAILTSDEALITFLDVRYTGKLPEEEYVWVVTKTDARWLKLDATPAQIASDVAALRCGLDQAAWEGEGESRCADLLKTNYRAVDAANGKPLPFDLARANALYIGLFGQIESLIKDKRLLVVPSGPLTALPFQVLVTAKPERAIPPDERGYASAAWFAKRSAVTVLPSVASLAGLRKFAKASKATQPFIGFGNPLLSGPNGSDRSAWERQSCTMSTASMRIARRGVRGAVPRFFRNGLANVEVVRTQYPLPETADELCAVARSMGASQEAIYLGEKATESTIKAVSASGTLAAARVVHFATHGLLAGQTATLTGSRAEPALLWTPPTQPTEYDDGLLTASEISQLKLDADWVVLSACNTAGGETDKPDAEALSGLARAFFYAGARALLVSHWAVDSEATVELITKAFDVIKADPGIGRAEALRRSMLALIQTGNNNAHPAKWAPFVVVGEGSR
jgi:CHAT domain-containing protein/tetratricopeptide (TPR) repeat protein